jgi:plastocyanin
MTRLLRIVVACLLVAAAAGCSGSAPSAIPAQPSSTGPVPAGPRITISALSYGAALSVRPGTRVVVVNEDDVAHTVTSNRKGKFDAHVAAHGWVTFDAPSEPGSYGYYCIYHPAMLGTLIVQ